MQVNERQFSGDIRGQGGAPVVVSLRGELDHDTLADADVLLARAEALASGDIWVDVSELRFISASGLGALGCLADRVTGRGHRVHLVGAEPLLVRMLEITGLAPYFQLVPAG